MTQLEIVRALRHSSERLSLRSKCWSAWSATDFAIGEAINAATGVQNLLRQLRAASETQAQKTASAGTVEALDSTKPYDFVCRPS